MRMIVNLGYEEMEVKLNNIRTFPPGEATKKEARKSFRVYCKALFELQNRFYADSRYSMLIILQGMDTSGKDGTIRRVMSCMNPQGVQVKSFRQPTEDEKKHDFLWRIYPHFPEKGMIKVFNRSYYEDILVPLVNGNLPDAMLVHRANLINELEHHLHTNHTVILKFYLHISRDIQLARIQERKTKPHKQWKYTPQDDMDTLKWDKYMDAYQKVLSNCNVSPWHLIPSDKRWYRNYSVAKILTEKLHSLNLHYPNAH